MHLAAEELLSETAKVQVGRIMQALAEARADGEPPVQDNLDVYSVSLQETVKGRPVLDLQAEYWSVDAAGDTGEVYCYSRNEMFNEEKDRAGVLTQSNALTEDAALKIFLPLAARLGHSLRREDCDIRFADYQSHEKETLPELERNLEGCVWEIRCNFTYKGIPCPERQLVVVISATSGRVNLIVNKPVVLPATEGENVTKEQAVQISAFRFANQPYFTHARGRNARIREGASEKARWVIACPNTFLDGKQSSAERYVGPVAYYCWEVPFDYEVIGEEQPELFNAVVWVDADGGKVIGGRDIRE
jgi:hypothetical protein